jgi:PAB-dependent poly(A)-specific ribonuclease subunit 2
VQPISKEEALDFSPKWKTPSVLCYQLKSPHSVIDNSWKDKIDTWLLYNDFNYLGQPRREEQTVLLTPEEAPKKGTFVALDAEFVSLQKEENEIKADGMKVIVRPSRLGLARVSVLRGEGEMEGVPFIDDYIATKETVVDFLTEYSGIHPGDLDPAVSRRALVSLKVAYKRLWILLNLGCTFVGHGLPKDFRIINIHVPKDQVIDTVDLYVLRATSRKLSLRFLAWVVLSDHIQTETHDSNEDSRTALRLYKKYCEYQDAGVLEEVLDRVYREGIGRNFKPPQLAAAAQQALPPVPRSEGSTPLPK